MDSTNTPPTQVATTQDTDQLLLSATLNGYAADTEDVD